MRPLAKYAKKNMQKTCALRIFPPGALFLGGGPSGAEIKDSIMGSKFELPGIPLPHISAKICRFFTHLGHKDVYWIARQRIIIIA